MAEQRLCPTCGAYWSCECPVELPVVQPVIACEHDWTEAVGVELFDAVEDESHVFLCRLCGLYAVSESNAGTWRR
jgi:hypothetical protein